MERKNVKFIDMRILLFMTLLIMMINCKNDYSKSDKELNYLRQEIMNNGNSSAYIELATYHENKKLYGETLPYSIVMINKYNYKRSYSKVAEEVISLNNKGKYKIEYLNKLNDGDKKFILYYLNLGVKNNDIECIYLFEKIYREGLGVDKNFKIADSLKQIYNKRMK